MTAVAAVSRVRSVNPAAIDVEWEAPVAGADDSALAVGAADAVVGIGNEPGLEPSARVRCSAAPRRGLAHFTRRYLGHH